MDICYLYDGLNLDILISNIMQINGKKAEENDELLKL